MVITSFLRSDIKKPAPEPLKAGSNVPRVEFYTSFVLSCQCLFCNNLMDVDILALAKEICDLFLYVFKYFKKRELKQGQKTFFSRSSRYKVGILCGFCKEDALVMAAKAVLSAQERG